MKFVCLLITLLLFAGCKKQKCECVIPYEISYLKGVVINTSFGPCSKPMVDFTEDSARLRAITGSDISAALVKDLDPALTVQGKKLYVDAKALSAAEDFPCPTSVDFPRIKALDTKPRD